MPKKYYKRFYGKSFDENLKRTFKTTAKLNMRKGPNLTADIITVIPKDQQVSCKGYYNENWYHVSYNNFTGYCLKDFLQ